MAVRPWKRGSRIQYLHAPYATLINATSPRGTDGRLYVPCP